MMSEMLSQEEIDALLKGDSATAPQDNSSSQAGHDSVLTTEEIDALGEIGNISMGTSATTLFTCLLYTSDAADDLLCVDLGGRRIIKNKNIRD